MKPFTARLLTRAEQAIRSANLLVREGDLEAAVSRAYYAMFYSAEALLFEKGFKTRKHSGAHALFGEHFAKTGLLDRRHHRALLDAFDRRLQADYGSESILTRDDVSQTIQAADDLLQAARQLLESQSPPAT